MKLSSYFRKLIIPLIIFAAGMNSPSAYQLTLFPARASFSTDVRTLHRNLQLSEAALVVEDFEDEELVPGLTATVSGAFDGTNGQSLTNPNAWDGNPTSSAATMSKEAPKTHSRC
ncbi:MAG: hypothetical protein L0Z50_30410 [Verrucomicrobiales bacterium]|nr:hypothetical protein [Verrucomicrobiales bacterium]